MKKTLIIVGTALLLAAGSVSAQNIAVSGTSPINGSFSFDITYAPPNTTDTYVSKVLGSGIKNCTLAFTVRPTGLVLSPAADEKFVTFARILRENGPARTRMIFYVTRSNNGNAFRYAAAVSDDGNTFRFRNGFLGNIDSNMEIRITSSSPSGANNGSFEVFRNGVSSATFNNIDLDDFDCNELRVGEQFGQTRTNAAGTLKVDDFVVTQQ